MSASSGEKRRRKRDRQFLEFYDTLSVRATVAGVGGSIVLLLFVVARSLFSS
jgi:transposase-like protein